MKLRNSVLSMVIGAAALFAAGQASDIAPCPDDYRVQAANYVESRLTDAHGARVQVVSEPYRIATNLKGYSGLEGWGVDIKVRSRLPNGEFGGYVPYTVVFINGEAVALCEDTDDLMRV